ncbi:MULTISPECIES: ribonuclease P protein component [unclassified Microbacterium]|uniref:ribonuclease P protein component n=1 Tax=unclassified Microbacterium TaxID=2609290 RepID=UPI001AC885E1|nr:MULTISPECIES: ribonuclease P protein component [unclassified Microbacterium]MBN9216177.1 ribonuclease P protein component [Microbacterium sp.]
MLGRGNRITRGADYRSVVRGGSRCSGPRTVTYVVTTSEDRPPRFGFIVSKQVGTAVTRNTVRRRLKAVCAEVLPHVRPGADVVIRALPSAASADFAELRSEVTRCLQRRAAA